MYKVIINGEEKIASKIVLRGVFDPINTKQVQILLSAITNEGAHDLSMVMPYKESWEDSDIDTFISENLYTIAEKIDS